MKTISVIACKGNDEIAGMTRKELYFEIVNRLTVDYKMRTGDLMKLYDKDTGKYISPKIISYHHDETTGKYIPQIITEERS